MAYGRGGTEPTVTDALVMLGILSTDEGFAGGSFRLKRDGVEEAFAAIGEEMGNAPGLEGAEQAAFDAWRVVNANMSQGVRRTTAGKGIDPKDLVMLAYGGNGPAFAAIQAEDLGISTVLVPKASPTFSALGTLVANPMIDEERSVIVRASELDLDKLRRLWEELCNRAEKYFTDAQFAKEKVVANYQFNMRYPGQNFTLTFDIQANGKLHDLSFIDETIGARATELFNARHMEEYNHIREDEVPEVTGVRLASHVVTASPKASAGFTAKAAPAVPAKKRRANLGQGFGEVPIYLGTDLVPGSTIAAPAIIEETFTTIVVYPGWKARVDDAGDYELVRV
jgi:N-methylhydantoinase A